MTGKKSKKADANKAELESGNAHPKEQAEAKKPVKRAATRQEEKKEAAVLKEGKARDIGVPVKNPPALVCTDINCAYHGKLSVRGRIFEGTVISDRMEKGVVVEWDYLQPLPKYKRFMRKKSRVAAHNPPCIKCAHGKRRADCRMQALSKTKSFVVIEIKK